MRRDPASWVLIGTVVLIAFLAMPGSLIIAAVVLLAIGAFRSARSRRRSSAEKDYATRFHELEQGILSGTSVDNETDRPASKRAGRSRKR
jgi:hypothetical protein